MIEPDPESVWYYFEKISEIPRCSKNEKQIGEYIKSVAEENGLESHQDETGNIVLKKPATKNDDSPVTILQSHMDMVCEKNEDVDHDFLNDPIQLERTGDWITAKGTTLGADNGIGVAISLAIATSEEIDHGPIEFLFTVDEETGLTGASKLEPEMLEGRKLVNLDSEEFGTITIGCAGGGKSMISLPVETETRKGRRLMQVAVSGLKGGHSGVDINKGRANSIKVLGRLLWRMHKETDDQVLLHGISGGNKDNAIPREAKATLYADGPMEDLERSALSIAEEIKEEYREEEPDIEIGIREKRVENGTVLLGPGSSKRAIYLIQALPHGVLSMSQKVQGLVKTSTNLAKVAGEKDELDIVMKTRSSSKSELETTRDQIRAIAEMCGADVEENQPYPGWEPDPDSELLSVFKETFEETFARKAETQAIHAGLETGIIGEKYQDMDMIAIGPTIKNPHSPDEKLNVKSVEKFWKHLLKSLEALAE